MQFKNKDDPMSEWNLPKRFKSQSGEVAYNVLGQGPPVVLVHGTPSWSYLWRHVAKRLMSDWSVHVYDLVGYGCSERFESQDVSIRNQARILRQLLGYWQLEDTAVCIAGHDIGGAIVLAASLLEGCHFAKIALVDAVILSPWITPTTQHQQKYLECYRTMPIHIYEQVALAHLRTAFYLAPDEHTLKTYFKQWQGMTGRAAWFRKVEQFDESVTDQMEPMLSELQIPVRLLWGEHDTWLTPEVAKRSQVTIPGSRLEFIPDAGHFSPEDNPTVVCKELNSFFSST
jgi:pimeloyl-ACP methyl ester carboxylesterase